MCRATSPEEGGGRAYKLDAVIYSKYSKYSKYFRYHQNVTFATLTSVQVGDRLRRSRLLGAI